MASFLGYGGAKDDFGWPRHVGGVQQPRSRSGRPAKGNDHIRKLVGHTQGGVPFVGSAPTWREASQEGDQT